MPIDNIFGGIQTPPLLPTGGSARERTPATGAAGAFGRMVDAVESTNASANAAVGKMLDGTGDVHDAMIALQRADLTFQFSVQVRNKLVQAYQEIMRMPM